jgi:hypothetical protein
MPISPTRESARLPSSAMRGCPPVVWQVMQPEFHSCSG